MATTLAFGLLAVLLAGLAASGAARAQARPETPVVIELKGSERSEDVGRMVDALRRDGRGVTVRMADPSPGTLPVRSAGDAAPAAIETPPAAPMADPAGFLAQLVASLRMGAPSLRAVPTLGPDFARSWSGDASSGVVVWAILLAAFGIAAAIGWMARGGAARALALHGRTCTTKTASRLTLSLRRLGADIVGAVAMLIVFKLLADAWTPSGAMAAVSANAAQKALGVFAMYILVGRFLLAPGHAESRLLRLPRADYHYRLLLIYVIFGQAIFLVMSLAEAATDNRAALAGLFFVFSTIMTLFKIWWFWNGRHDIATLIVAAAPDPEKPGLARRAVAAATPWIFIASSLALWIVARVAVMMPDGARWAWVAGATQFIIVLLPIAAIGAAHLMRDLHHHAPGEAPPSPLRKALGVVGERAAAGAAWLLGVVLLARLWGDFFAESGSQMAVAQMRNVVAVAGVLVAGYLVLIFLQTLFDAHAPKRAASMPGDEDAHEAVQTRIGSVLPLLRGVAIGAIVVLTTLVALSKLGVDTGPLLAGFGILGLAISFGSQALVRDIVSGFFFMVEDAFRVGEYIDTGRLKGTVEKISVRSVQLRHQSGQVHTIPFGQIASVTNASRDWATLKFNIKLDRNVDLEKARKTIKKAGLAMLEDPEIGSDFILPLKLQGVQEITETGIVLRLKFTAKPAQSSFLQREALKRVYRALNEAGVHFASNAVTVLRSGDEVGAAALVNMTQRAANAAAPAA